MDPSMKLFEFDKDSLLASIPTMYGFPKVRVSSPLFPLTIDLTHEIMSPVWSRPPHVPALPLTSVPLMRWLPLNYS